MRATIVSTERFAKLDGLQCRVWEGTTERGVPFLAYVAGVAVREDQDGAQFEEELRPMPPRDVDPPPVDRRFGRDVA